MDHSRHSREIDEAYGIIDKLAKYIERLENSLTTLGYTEMLQNLRDDFNKEDQANIETQNIDETETNPMLIQNIVENVCEYLHFQALQSLRLVHPCWDKAIMTPKRLQNTRMVMKFSTSNPNDPNGTKTLKRLLATYPIETTDSDQGSCPVSSRPLPRSIWISKLGSENNQEELLKWFQSYGRTVTSLELGNKDSDFSKVQSNRLFQLLAEMPNLEELKIQEFDFKGPLFESEQFQPLKNLKTLEIGHGKEMKGTPEDIKNLLKLTTELKRLKLWIKPSEGLEDMKDRQEHYLQICYEQGYLTNLIELNLSKTPLTYPALKLLESAKFTNLKSLALGSIKEIHGQPQVPQQPVFTAFSNLFQNLQPTLEELRIKSATFILKSLPLIMSNVQVLEIHDFWLLEQDAVDERMIGFLSKFPNLKSLVLNAPSTMHIRYLPSAFVVLNPQLLLSKAFPSYPLFQISSLYRLELINTPLEQEPFHRLVQSFPELRVLILTSGSYDGGDHLIWEFGSFLTELAVTTRLEELDLQLDYRLGIEDAESQLNEAIAKNFFKLNSLKRFKFACKKRKIKILEKAVTLGFAQAPSLKYLELQKFTIEPEIQSLFDSLSERVRLRGCIATDEI